jgi:HEXXH motif-containing protein
MTRPQNPTWFALSLAHEVQHVKLTAVTDLFRLLDAEQEDLYYAPWRTDPRPTFGLLHGMYAHLGVVGFWQRQLSHLSGEPALQAEIEFARWHSAAMEVGQTLAVEARLTPAGRIFLGGMIDTIDRLRAVPVSAAAIDAATRLSNAHRALWSATSRGGSS